MNHKSEVKTTRSSDRQRVADLDLDSLSEEQLRALYDEIFGEPSDEEIAAVLREAQAEFESVGYSQPPENSDEFAQDDEPYREPTRQEILAGIKEGYLQALAGLGRPIQELLDELEE